MNRLSVRTPEWFPGAWFAGVGLAGLLAASAAAQVDEPLPEGEGRNIVSGLCAGCHSLSIVKQQGMSRERWAWTLDWMVAKQGMPQLPPEMHEQVLNYLAEHYGPEREQPAAPGVGGGGGGFAPAPPPPPS